MRRNQSSGETKKYTLPRYSSFSPSGPPLQLGRSRTGTHSRPALGSQTPGKYGCHLAPFAAAACGESDGSQTRRLVLTCVWRVGRVYGSVFPCSSPYTLSRGTTFPITIRRANSIAKWRKKCVRLKTTVRNRERLQHLTVLWRRAR